MLNKKSTSLIAVVLVTTMAMLFSTFIISAAPPCGSPKTGPCPEPTTAPEPTPVFDGVFDTLVWSDEFDGNSVNLNNWTYDVGGDGWGNNELQWYTDGGNATVANGFLTIEAREERVRSRNYTSARLKTQGLQSFTYGRIEARIKVPYGQGIWPAFWTLGTNITEVGWPNSGEIDIMEHIGREPYNVYGTVHGPGYSGEFGVGNGITLAEPVTNNFHIFAIEWEPGEIRWYLDGQLYHTVTPQTVPGEWVFDHDFFLILNIAVGGYWPGYPDATTVFPQQMIVDYVRVYQ